MVNLLSLIDTFPKEIAAIIWITCFLYRQTCHWAQLKIQHPWQRFSSDTFCETDRIWTTTIVCSAPSYSEFTGCSGRTLSSAPTAQFCPIPHFFLSNEIKEMSCWMKILRGCQFSTRECDPVREEIDSLRLVGNKWQRERERECVRLQLSPATPSAALTAVRARESAA